MIGDSLGIVEFRNIISSINEYYGVDFSNYALTSFKRRLEKFIHDNRIAYPVDLIEKIRSDSVFYEKFLRDITVKDTEMFRDPSYWIVMRNEILPKLLKEGNLKIWVANSNSGEELYSLAITLSELGMLHKARIIATNISQKNIDYIKTGVYDLKKIEAYQSNYERTDGVRKLSDYYITNNNKAYMDSSLIDNVEFVSYNMFAEESLGEFKFISFRNVMLYYNRTLQNQALEIIYNSLLKGGFMAIGIKETLSDVIIGKYILVNKDEKIYKKI